MKRPWIVVGVAVAALLGTTTAVWTGTADAAETLLSRGKPAIASSVEASPNSTRIVFKMIVCPASGSFLTTSSAFGLSRPISGY